MLLTIQFFVEIATGCYGEGPNKLLKLYGAIVVLIKDTKNQRREFGWVSIGEELGVDLNEALFCQKAIWTILQKAFMPLLEILTVCLGGQLVQRVLLQLRVLR